jgi:hypothetical protein
MGHGSNELGSRQHWQAIKQRLPGPIAQLSTSRLITIDAPKEKRQCGYEYVDVEENGNA